MRWNVGLLIVLGCATPGAESGSSADGFCASPEGARPYWSAIAPISDPDYPHIDVCVERSLLSEQSHTSICEFLESRDGGVIRTRQRYLN